MALIVRIDVDRPYGKQGFVRHVASRIASDYYLPRLSWLRYLEELETILRILNQHQRQAWVFFRKCTYPTPAVHTLMQAGGHQYGLHLENSRSETTFREEFAALSSTLGRPITSFSKHGSGKLHLGRHHYAPYEPDRYLPWAVQSGLKFFFGNQEDPRILPQCHDGLVYFPSAFWLEPYWRDTTQFPIEWLLEEAQRRDIVLLLHPDNVTSSPEIMQEFLLAIAKLPSTICPSVP